MKALPSSSQQRLLGPVLQEGLLVLSPACSKGYSEVSQPATIRPTGVCFLPPFISNLLPLIWCFLKQHSIKALPLSAQLYVCPVSGLLNIPSWRIPSYH